MSGYLANLARRGAMAAPGPVPGRQPFAFDWSGAPAGSEAGPAEWPATVVVGSPSDRAAAVPEPAMAGTVTGAEVDATAGWPAVSASTPLPAWTEARSAERAVRGAEVGPATQPEALGDATLQPVLVPGPPVATPQAPRPMPAQEGASTPADAAAAPRPVRDPEPELAARRDGAAARPGSPPPLLASKSEETPAPAPAAAASEAPTFPGLHASGPAVPIEVGRREPLTAVPATNPPALVQAPPAITASIQDAPDAPANPVIDRAALTQAASAEPPGPFSPATGADARVTRRAVAAAGVEMATADVQHPGAKVADDAAPTSRAALGIRKDPAEIRAPGAPASPPVRPHGSPPITLDLAAADRTPSQAREHSDSLAHTVADDAGARLQTAAIPLREASAAPAAAVAASAHLASEGPPLLADAPRPQPDGAAAARASVAGHTDVPAPQAPATHVHRPSEGPRLVAEVPRPQLTGASAPPGPQAPRPAAAGPARAPEVSVRIGRVELRTPPAPPAPPARRTPSAAPPSRGFADYALLRSHVDRNLSG